MPHAHLLPPGSTGAGGPAGSGTAGGWGWRGCFAGMIVAFAPELLLYGLAALSGTSGSTTTRVTVASALTLVIGSIVLYAWHLFAAWLFSVRSSLHRHAAWGFRRPPKAIFWTVPAALFAAYAVLVANDAIVHPKQQAIIGHFPHGAAGTALFVLLAVVIAPLAEETFFRGFLFRGFSNSWGWVIGAAVSAAIFGAAHLQLSIFLPLFALGFALAWVYKRTGSLWSSIALHAIFNGIFVLAWVLTA